MLTFGVLFCAVYGWANALEQYPGVAADVLYLARNPSKDVKSEKPAAAGGKTLSFKRSKLAYSSYLKGLLYVNDGDNKQALREFKKVLAIDPDLVHARLKMAVVMMRLGQMEAAERELKAAKKMEPDNIDASLALIFLYSYIQDESSLEGEYGSFLEKAHLVKPENIKISEYLAQFYFYKNRIADAIKVYETIVGVDPGYVEGKFWLGYLYSETGKIDQAIKIWQDVLILDAAHAPTLNSLGYTYAESGIKLDEAEAMVKKAVEKEPENGAYLDSLGWIYFKKKQYALADEYLNKALVFLRDPVVYDHLGRVWIEAGDINKALGYYREGADYFPEDKILQENLKRYGTEDKVIKE